tara:strand:+ start:634 stop:1809 length:1176 start_codon:yes stop_codon:yes gene_type:complete
VSQLQILIKFLVLNQNKKNNLMALKKFKFNVLNNEKFSRIGLIETHRGNIHTPVFMPVGTQATVKATFIDDILKTGSEIILGNTYHLMLRPGVERIKNAGGLHKFMNCSLPILTDSGGFQVMSLSKLNKIDKDKGAIFNSHIDGKKFILSPEESIRIQKGLNSDIVMVMDECPKKSNDYNKIQKSMNLSIEWAQRSKKAFGKNPEKALFGIVQGGLFNDLRSKSLTELTKIGFDGYAIGGLAVGETQKEMFNILDKLKNIMPVDKPRYLMGVGTPSDIIGAVKRGVDMFDCVLPTRSGRTGLAFTWNGRLNLKNSIFKNDNKPLDKNCEKFNLNKYSKNYLNHLFNTNEILASMILTLHNINFYQELMSTIRENIKNGTFDTFHDKYFGKL